jgi:hypothetical protein
MIPGQHNEIVVGKPKVTNDYDCIVNFQLRAYSHHMVIFGTPEEQYRLLNGFY